MKLSEINAKSLWWLNQEVTKYEGKIVIFYMGPTKHQGLMIFRLSSFKNTGTGWLSLLPALFWRCSEWHSVGTNESVRYLSLA